MKKLIQIICLILISNLFDAQTTTPTFQWANQVGAISSGNVSEVSIFVDGSGNTYVAGNFVGTTDFDPSAAVYTLSPVGQTDVFISKYDLSGNLVWVKSFGSVGFENPSSLTLDALGNIYICGAFQYTVDFDPGPSTYSLVSSVNNTNDGFVLKLTNAGNFVWAKRLGGALNEKAFCVKLDGLNNVYFGFLLMGTIDADPGPAVFNMTSIGSQDAMICKLDLNGNFIWAKQFGGSSAQCFANSLEVDAAGDLCISGIFNQTADFDPGAGVFNLNTGGSNTGFISKLNFNGAFVWAKQIGGVASSLSISSLVTDQNNNIYLTGNFFGTADLDPGPSVLSFSSVGTCAFVIKSDASCNLTWAKQIVASSQVSGNAIKVDANTNVYFIGTYQGVADFDPGPSVKSYTSMGGIGTDVFIEKLDINGNYDWSAQFGEYNPDNGSAIFVDGSNNVHAAGDFSGIIDVDPGPSTYTLNGSSDMYLIKYGQCTFPSSPTNITPASNLIVCGPDATTLTAMASGTIAWYGQPVGGGAIATGSQIVTVTLPIGTYTYYAEAITCTNSVSRAAIVVTVVSCANTDEVNRSQEALVVYPNPSNGAFVIDIPLLSKITVLDVLGKIIFANKVEAGKHNIDLSEFKNGIYLLKLESASEVKTLRLIKE